MALKLQLVNDGEVLFEMPLSVERWPKDELKNELDRFEDDFEQFSEFFDVLSNEGRLRMMKQIFEDEDLTLGFSDFMRELNHNPKIVWESTRKLTGCGLQEKSEEGKYTCNRHGQAEFLMVSLALSRLMRALQEFEEW